jgi:inorganic pyrophosphatase
VLDIRNLNKLDKLIEGKIDYKLADGTIIAINESTQDKLAELFKDEQEIIEHMRESKENFIDVLKQIGE